MRRAATILVMMALVPAFASSAGAQVAGQECATIPSGTITDSTGQVLAPGYDVWGYSYQARRFNGGYCDAYRNADWCQAWVDVRLSMSWNDAWLSNKDCNGDGFLDRHYGFEDYRGSGAWLTNHQRGTYTGENGRVCHWVLFVKIVAAPDDAEVDDGVWIAADGSVMGEVIWQDFAIVQEVLNDPCQGTAGLQFVAPGHAGLGYSRP